MIRVVTAVSVNEDNIELSLDCHHLISSSKKQCVGDQIDCNFCDLLQFPEGLRAYKKTPIFNQDTIPKGFRRAHSTKRGVWAIINIVSGKVGYVIDHLEAQNIVLDSHTKGIIAPEMEHHLDVVADVEMYVEFYTT